MTLTIHGGLAQGPRKHFFSPFFKQNHENQHIKVGLLQMKPMGLQSCPGEEDRGVCTWTSTCPIDEVTVHCGQGTEAPRCCQHHLHSPQAELGLWGGRWLRH